MIKMYFIHIFIFLQAVQLPFSFDIEMEGVVRLGDSVLEMLNTEHKTAERYSLPHEINVRSKSKLPKKFSRSSIMRANSVVMNKSDELIEFVDYIKSTGVTTLRTIAKQIFKGMKIHKNYTRKIDFMTYDYTTTMQQYLEYITSQKTLFTIDEEFTFLDMLETSCRLLYREQKKLLNFAISAAKLMDDQLNSATKDNRILNKNSNNKDTVTLKSNFTKISRNADIQRMNQLIYKQGVKTKKEELRYICNKYEICRPYPALTDYLADFIVELLKLSDDKLKTFIKLLRLLAKTNEEFFNRIINNEDKENIIVPQLSELLNNINGFQETLLLLRGLLTQRFKIINNPNMKLKMRTQAVRILFDIANQAYQYENDDLIAIEIDTVVKNIRSWNSGHRHFPEASLVSLVNNILYVLDYNLGPNAKNEVKVLMETLIRGSSRNEDLFRQLFSEGSKYVKGEDIVHGLHIL